MDAGETASGIAERLNVPLATLYRWYPASKNAVERHFGSGRAAGTRVKADLCLMCLARINPLPLIQLASN